MAADSKENMQSIIDQLFMERAELLTRLKRVEAAIAALGYDLLEPTKNGKGGRPREHAKCTVEGCGGEHVALGLCAKHYADKRRANLRKK